MGRIITTHTQFGKAIIVARDGPSVLLVVIYGEIEHDAVVMISGMGDGFT